MSRPSSAAEIAARIRSGQITAVDAVTDSLERIDALDGELNAFVCVDHDGAMKVAREIDASKGRGESLGPLAGVPLGVKDNLCVAGLPMTCGSRILDGHVPSYTATCVQNAIEAGCVIVGKTNLDEFAMGSSTEHSARGPSLNPWDRSRVPGGSSGGSAVAVAAGMVPLALGSDTGGSIRQPAAFCGVVGMKPSYGWVSRKGLVAFASSLDQVGPFARTVEDASLLFSAIAGVDTGDATCLTQAERDGAPEDGGEPGGVEGLRIGLPTQFFGDGLDPAIESNVRGLVAELERGGATLVEVDLPHVPHAIPTYYLVANSEASSNLARYDGVRYGWRGEDGENAANMIVSTRSGGFGDEVKRRIMLGTFALSAGYYDAYYDKATRVRACIAADFERAFQQVDVIVGPTTPTPAFRLGEKVDDPVSMYLSDVYTAPANLAGIPGISLPCGFVDVDGVSLPVGFQILGPHLGDARVLEAARTAAQTAAGGQVAARWSAEGTVSDG